MEKIAVLLTCFNRKAKTLKCLTNLYKQDGHKEQFSIDVYLVDDASTDGTFEAVHENFPEVNLIRGNGQLFWNRGMYTAWRAALDGEYDYYMWLNDDTILFNDAILELLSCSKLVIKACLVCGATSSEITNEFTYGGATKEGVSIIPNGEIQRCDIINGNCILVSNAAVKLAGILDPIYLHANGDHDYGLRLLKLGGVIITTRKYIANCERNTYLPKWCYSSTPFLERMKVLYSPLGNSHPVYFFIYEKRHFGFLTAIKHFLSIHLRVLMPSLWKV